MREGIEIRHAKDDQDIKAVRALFSEYQQWLGVDLCFQGFTEELEGLPGEYSLPAGCLIVVCDDKQYVGVIGVRPLAGSSGSDVCEMKRLYVRPPWRGRGIGRTLSEAAMNWAQEAGYARIRLDTLGNLVEARALYASQGFREIEAYYDNPLEAPIYMERNL
ncbi:MAG: GNAT family N-acetyltransferase [Rhodospirillales bacterium]|nr:GNAT family N-acetyltransferase [Rhodospirillales bacterium]